MKIKLLFVAYIFVSFSCKEDISTPCDSLENGIYIYPTIEDSANNRQEVDSIYSIPSSILNCITTKGLVETCTSHPFFIFYVLAGNTPISSYKLLKNKINGIEELETREDAADVMLDKYLNMNPEDITSNTEKSASYLYFYSFELLFSQKLFLDELTLEERVLLTTECLEEFEVKKNVYDDSHFAVFGTSYIINTLMLIDKYPEHSSFYNPYLTNPDSVLTYADDYLAFIKNKFNDE